MSRRSGAPASRWLAALAVTVVVVGSAVPGKAQAQTSALNMRVATYDVSFEILFTEDALASGVTVPADGGIRAVRGATHNSDVSIWSSGGTASAAIEALAEEGDIGPLHREIQAHWQNGDVYRRILPTGTWLQATGTKQTTFSTTQSFPLVSLAAQIEPSPDWFVGLDSLSLRKDGEWLRHVSVDLYAWDAGTENGTEFDEDNPATVPQGTIVSLRNTGKFSDNQIARVTFTLQGAGRVTGVSADPGEHHIDVAWREA